MAHDHEHGCDCGCEESGVILFQGDSITDAGRDRNDPASLGSGYPMLVAAMYQAKHPEVRTEFVNRGISGNRVHDLVVRWDDDCLALKPDVVTVLIGVNDTWRRYDSNDPNPVDSFEESYRNILTRARENLECGIVLMEPFLVPISEQVERMRVDLDPKIHVVRKLAREFRAELVPLDGIFAKACASREPEFWAADGVHPTLAGHGLIARAWLDVVDD